MIKNLKFLFLACSLLSMMEFVFQENIITGTVSTIDVETEVIAYIDGQQSYVVQFTNS